MPRPFGNDFIVGTPKLDQLGQRIYLEQRQRELNQQNQVKALDEEFSRNVSNIRDADVDDLTKLYGDYKMATQATMRQKGGVSPKEQLEVLRKKADLYKLVNESKAEREREELVGKRYAIKPDDFNDDAAEMMITGRKLPISQKRSYKTAGKDGKEVVVDLTNPENFMYQDKMNWQPILQKAGGTLVPRGQIVKKAIPGGLEEEEITYKGGNDPMEFYSSVVGSFTNARADGSLAKRYQFTPEEAQDITTKFEALRKTPEFKNAYGDVSFPETSNATPGTRTAKLLAMTNALNNPPTGVSKKVPIKAAIMDRTEAHKEKMFQIAEGGRNFRASLNRVRPNLGDYDILSIYDPKVQEVEIEVKSPTEKDWLGNPKTIKQKSNIIYTKDIDGNDEKYFEGANPIKDKNGSYYIQRSDGDYEGANGKVIQRKTAAIKFMGNPAAYKGGVVNTPQNKPNSTPSNQPKKKVYNPKKGKFE